MNAAALSADASFRAASATTPAPRTYNSRPKDCAMRPAPTIPTLIGLVRVAGAGGAPQEQEFPFGLLNLESDVFLDTSGFCPCFIAPFDEEKRIPSRLQPPAEIFVGLKIRGGASMKRLEYGMSSDAAEPVAGVPGIRLDAVSNPMPIAALRRGDVLRDAVAFVPAAQQQQQTADGSFWIAGVGKQSGCRRGGEQLGGMAITIAGAYQAELRA